MHDFSNAINLLVIDEPDASFIVRMVKRGQKYGLEDCLTNEKDDPLIEFYDSKSGFTPYGQFVSRYYCSTLLEGRRDPLSTAGLNLHGGVDKWSVSADGMQKVVDWLKEWSVQ